jgi:hypothetical protein
LSGHAVTHLDRIAHGPDVRVGGLEMVVYPDAAEFADFQTGVFWQADFWFHTQPENHGVGGQSFTAFQHHDGSAGRLMLCRRLERYDGVVQMQGNSIGLQLRLQPGCHFRVEGRHHLG